MDSYHANRFDHESTKDRLSQSQSLSKRSKCIIIVCSITCSMLTVIICLSVFALSQTSTTKQNNIYDERSRVDSEATNNDSLEVNGSRCANTMRKRGSHMLSYGPGDYRLTPYDYYCVNYLIVEMWGGGGCGGGNGGGGGGAYVKANIIPYLQDIIIHVGHGGMGTITFDGTFTCHSLFCNTTLNHDSWISVGNLNLTAGGGFNGCYNNQSARVSRGGIVSVKNTDNVIAIPGNDARTANGGSSPFGGNGGIGAYNYGGYEDGHLPGGGGSYYYGCDTPMVTTFNLTKGGNGMINVYFVV